MTNIVDCSSTMTNTIVDCSGLTKEQVLVSLYSHSLLHNQNVPLQLRMMSMLSNVEITEDEAKKVFDSTQSIDYLQGVMIKTKFDTFPLLDSRLFDENTGSGSMLTVVNSLLTNKN